MTASPTLVIVLPPLFKPFAVKLIGLVGSLVVIVTPLLFTLVAPVVTLPVVPKLISFASFTVKASLAVFTTPILLSVKSVVLPPCSFKVSFKLRSTVPPLSPTKLNLAVPTPPLAASAIAFTAAIAPSMVFAVVPPILLAVTVPFAGLIVVLPPTRLFTLFATPNN